MRTARITEAYHSWWEKTNRKKKPNRDTCSYVYKVQTLFTYYLSILGI